MRKLIALLFLLFIGVTSIVLFCGALALWAATVLIDPRLVWLHYYTSFWAQLYVWVMPAWQVDIRQREKIDPRRTYVVVSNHQSLLDILVVFGLFFHFKWVSKAEIFRVPLIGWNMRLNRYIRLQRGDPESIKQMLDAAEKHLRQGSSIYLFPEGTRSVDGRLKTFKPGAFILARKLNLPILPIVINGTTNALPKHSLEFHGYHPISVTVLDAVEPEYYAGMDEAALADYTRNLMADQLAAMSGKPAADHKAEPKT